jgi:tellurite resistance protein TehA-like permease
MSQSQDSEEHGDEHRISALRIALRSFNSQWFLIPQGSGIVAITLHQLHYQFQGLGIIADIFWAITILTLVGFLLIYIWRAVVFPRYVANQFGSNFMETACLCSISIAFTTIIQMIALTLTPSWGPSWGMAAYVMWWINVAMAAVACIAIPYVLTKVDGPGISSVPPGALLPSIAALTIAAGGGVVCRYGAISASQQVPVIIVSYLFVGIGLPLAVIIDAVILARFFDRSFPMKQQVYQLLMICGPLGQGSFAMQILGSCVQRGAFAQYNTSSFISATGASTIATGSQFLGLLTWGYGIFWWAYACIAILHYVVAEPKALLKWDQTLSIWSLIFPWVSDEHLISLMKRLLIEIRESSRMRQFNSETLSSTRELSGSGLRS